MMRKLQLILVVSALALCAQAQPPAGAPGGGGGRGRGPQGPAKNLKVLTEENVRQSMQRATAGLGVQCAFCHNPEAFDSDEKREKVVARAMFGMVADLNTKFPDGKEHVTCYTCHRGEKEPAMAPPAGAGGDGAAGGRGGRGGPPQN
jgi:hypothetical protein